MVFPAAKRSLMHRMQCFLLVIATVLAVGTVALSTANAATVKHSASVEKSAKYCAVVLDRVRPGEKTSRALAKRCATDQETLNRDAAVSASTPLIKFFDCSGWYEPCGWIIYYGAYGTCDRLGYVWNYVGDMWNDKFSSFLVYGACFTTVVYRDWYLQNPAEAHVYTGNVHQIYSPLNNNTSSFKIRSGTY
jgi:hypothetical protein